MANIKNILVIPLFSFSLLSLTGCSNAKSNMGIGTESALLAATNGTIGTAESVMEAGISLSAPYVIGAAGSMIRAGLELSMLTSGIIRPWFPVKEIAAVTGLLVLYHRLEQDWEYFNI